ncbi:hypothetical protein HPB51_008933 [Rhipicephalus microplus]|uniref:Tick transposon n=1 Tax=Rhipicephalus microplus TaxID=6941 RepID=A0A9J6D4J6_RHIMP|nr:hypothetical protein HPB51_008933 [Rhipicephalus microplus]
MLLQNGLKFCEHPKLDKVELLGLVRSTVGGAKDDKIGRLVQEGVECLPQGVKTARQRSSAVVTSLRRAEVKLLQFDKEGGFVLMLKRLYESKAEEAMQKNFKVLPAIKETRSRGPRHSFGAVCTGAPKVSIASGEVPDSPVLGVDFIATDGAFNSTGPEVGETSLVSVVPLLLLEITGAFGGAVFQDGGTAEAAPPMGAVGIRLGT